MTGKKQSGQKYAHIFDFINRYWKENFAPPSIRDIKDSCKVSSTSVVNYILDTHAKSYGVIFKHNGKSRSITPLWVIDALSEKRINVD